MDDRDSRIRDIRFRPMERALRIAFATSRGAKHVHRFVLVRAALRGGAGGLGEVPTSLSYPHEFVPAILEALARVRPMLLGAPIDEALGLVPLLRRRLAGMRMTVSGLEVALLRAKLAATGQSEHGRWGGRLRLIETDITVPLCRDERLLRRWLTWACRKGFRRYKVKLSGLVEDDTRLLAGVSGFLAPRRGGFALRLDGNQAFTLRGAAALADWLARRDLPVELIEQPLAVADRRGLRELRQRCDVPIILDESVQGAADLRRVADGRLADGVNIKVAKSGLAESAEMIALARAAGLKLMIGCMTETAVGLSAGIALAAGTGAFDYVDLDSIHFFRHRGRAGPWRIGGPRYVLPGRAGGSRR